MLWREHVIGWANVAQRGESLDVQAGFVGARPCDASFRRAFEAEVERLREFLRGRRAPQAPAATSAR